MSCPYTSPQNDKVERIIHTINNVIHTLLIQASLPGRYWAEGFHTAVYLLNRLPTKAISAACPHVALFGSAPSYEHIRVFGCACYSNIAVTAPHKLAPRSTQCVFLGYSVGHKGFRCLDLSTNHLIVSRHVVFDEDSFSLTASPNLTDLDFLLESDSTVSTIRTRLPLAGSTTTAVYQPAQVVPPGFKPLPPPLPTSAVPPGFLPRATSMTHVVPHVAQSSPAAPSAATPTPVAPRAAPKSPTAPRAASSPPAARDGPPPREWPSSPIVYAKHPRQPTPTAPMGPSSTPPDRRPPITCDSSPDGHSGQGGLPGTSWSPSPRCFDVSINTSPISTSVRAALADPN
jgi:hypothetical protein